MYIEFLGMKGTWREVADAARTTINREPGCGEPSDSWKYKILKAEHSPIRKLIYKWRWYDLPYYASVHFVRHKIGIEHWVSTQRSDRTGIDRADLSQCALVTHECEANAQALINISRKRLCFQASSETKKAWELLKAHIEIVEPQLAKCMIRDCEYRGQCCEFKNCGWFKKENTYEIPSS
jgi:hypothetical protein